MKKTGIYKIINNLNNKVYVGSAIDIDTRWCKHKKMLHESTHHSKKLQNSYNKYGINNFTYEIIELCEKHFLLEREQYWIESFDSYKNGYNSRPIANSNLGLKLPISDETRKKIGLKSKGRKHTEDTKEKIREKRKLQIFSDETRKKLSDINRGKQFSEETKEKIRNSMKGKPPINKGKTYEELYGVEKAKELKEKKRLSNLGRKHSDETKKKLSEINKGKSYEEIYGVNKANEVKVKISKNNRWSKNKL